MRGGIGLVVIGRILMVVSSAVAVVWTFSSRDRWEWFFAALGFVALGAVLTLPIGRWFRAQSRTMRLGIVVLVVGLILAAVGFPGFVALWFTGYPDPVWVVSSLAFLLGIVLTIIGTLLVMGRAKW